MKYLKRIFESSRHDTYNSELSEVYDLQDFCEMYLAYLIDDDFEVNVLQHDLFKKSFSIIIKSKLSVSWDQIKDKLITFLEMLKKNYNFGSYAEQNFKFHKSWLDKSIIFNLESDPIITKSIDIDELIKDEPTYGYPRPGKYLTGIKSMEITVHPKDLNESQHEIPKRFTFEFQEKLRDFCETHLVYLADDGYSIGVANNIMSLKRFDKENDDQIYASLFYCDNEEIADTIDDPRNFNWDNIKNSFIPFLQHLSKQYNMKKIYFYGYPSTTSECMPYTYTLQRVLDDDNIVPVIYYIFLRID